MTKEEQTRKPAEHIIKGVQTDATEPWKVFLRKKTPYKNK